MSRKKAEYEPMDLYDFIETEASIHCSNCGEEDITMGEGSEDHFFEKGWRATKKGNVYCPECASKKLK
jgi:Zn finger protein HypA/HybF involved in hydrogenase expression